MLDRRLRRRPNIETAQVEPVANLHSNTTDMDCGISV